MSDSGDKGTSTRGRIIYRLDDLTIDVGMAQVRRNSQELPLPRLSFDLLLALVKAAPDLISVDELMNQVWPGLVVNAETVGQRIKLLREALDDDPKQPRYIAVSRGRGYRVIGQVTVDNADAGAGPSKPSPTKLPRWIWGAVIAAALVSLAAGYFLSDRPQPEVSASTLPDQSVAVLPFDNLGQSPEDAALAFGVAETLLHRLSGSKELTVIARQSSFSFAPRGADARDIGRKLNARYLVEGSLQSAADRLRITAQLIDATTGSQVWSLQFDRTPQDLFVIQDEIASKVSEAMRITLTEPTPARGRGTRDFDAYLAHAQGRARLASVRVPEFKLAIADFERAIRIDPNFVRAYASLAEARLLVAEFEMTEDRGRTFAKVSKENEQLLEKALLIDEQDSDVHLQLAELYGVGDRADRELARALQLNPNSAPAYSLLAHQRGLPGRLPDEGIIAIDKARQLSPLEIQYDNDKAMIVLYGKGDSRLAEQLSFSVLDRDPSSTRALWRLGEIYWCCRSQHARGIKFLEQALQREPDFERGRRFLMRAYLDLDDSKEAEAVAASAPHPVGARLVNVLAHKREWSRAAETSYEEDQRGTLEPVDNPLTIFAVRMQARSTRDHAEAIRQLTAWSGVTWDPEGNPHLTTTWMTNASTGLADILLLMGEREKADRLLEETLRSIDDEARTRGRGEFWYLQKLAVIHALLGRDEDALTMLEKCVEQGHTPALRLQLAEDPAFDKLRSQPRFQAVVDQMNRLTIAQRQELDEMRAKGLVPYRSRQ